MYVATGTLDYTEACRFGKETILSRMRGGLYCGYPEDERYSFTIKSGKMPGECENWRRKNAFVNGKADRR